MEALPDLASLSDKDLKELIERLKAEENEVSYRRRDPARADRHPQRGACRAAAEGGRARASLEHVDVERLSEILAGKASPPTRVGRRAAVSHIYCPECGFQNPEAANYCAQCGTRLVHDEAGPESTMTFTPEEGERTGDRPRRASRGRRSSSAPAAGGRARRSAAGRRDDDRPLAGLRDLPRRRHRLAQARGPLQARRRVPDRGPGSLNGTFVNRKRIESARGSATATRSRSASTG